MSKPKQKFTATVTPEKTRPEKSLVQLTEDQLKAIAGGDHGGCTPPLRMLNHNETMVNNSILKEVRHVQTKTEITCHTKQNSPRKAQG